MTRRGQLDLLDIKADWQNSPASVRDIGAKHGVSHARISQIAKSEGWGARGGTTSPKRRTGKLPTDGKLPNSGKLPSLGKSAAGKQLKSSDGTILATIGEFQKNRQEVVRLTIEEYRGHILVRSWIWYRDPKTDELKPTKKGLAVSPALAEQHLIPGLRNAVAKARELGLLADEVDQ